VSYESEALKEINELKAQVNALRGAIGEIDRFVQPKEAQSYINNALDSTSAQYLKQNNIALLNKLRHRFINSSNSCEHELLDMINRLELEK